MPDARKPSPPRVAVTKAEVARALDDVAAMLEITGDNPFRIRAFENAARAIEDLSEDLRTLVESGELLDVRGIGKSIFSVLFGNGTATGSGGNTEGLRRSIE